MTMVEGPRNVKTNKPYRNAYYRARNNAVARLIKRHREEFDRLLREERNRAGLRYKVKGRVR